MHSRSSHSPPVWAHAGTLLTYVVAGALAVRWTKPVLWDGRCGTESLTYFMLCGLWCGIMQIMAAWECVIAGGSKRLALRLALAGLAPVAVPLLVRLA